MFLIEKLIILEFTSLQKYDSIILSGRRKNDKKINEVNSKIINFSIKNKKKLLGICYGAEILALTLGGTIRKTKFIQKGNETIEISQNNLITKNSINVFESHAFEISKLPNILTIIGKSNNFQLNYYHQESFLDEIEFQKLIFLYVEYFHIYNYLIFQL